MRGDVSARLHRPVGRGRNADGRSSNRMTLPIGDSRLYHLRGVMMTVTKVDFQSFKESIAQPQPPAGLSLALQALWWDAKGDWNEAHERAQERDDAAGMRVHAYLHRKEGDLSNAGYWYRRSGTRPPVLTLDEEWDEMVRGFLGEG